MALLSLDEIPQVEVTFINEDHREEGRLLNELADAVVALSSATPGSRDSVDACLAALVEHTRAHFERENEAMRAIAFPPTPVHIGEHERVLAELQSVGEAFQSTGDVARLHDYVTRIVPAWFISHIMTMDRVTAHFIAANQAD